MLASPPSRSRISRCWWSTARQPPLREVILEIGWARVPATTITHAHASLIALPDGEQISPAVARITGISEHMMRSAVDGRCAWRELTDQAASLTQQPAPTVIHFARFEQPFLRTLAAGVCPLDVVCTRDIARRLLPHLPRCKPAALAGYFGRAIMRPSKRRSRRRPRSSGTSWSACSRQGVSTWAPLRLARRTCHTDQVPTPHLVGVLRTCTIADHWDLSHASDGRQRPGTASAKPRRCIIGSTATFGSRPACPSGCSRCCRRHARSRSTSHQVRSRPHSSSRMKSSGTDRTAGVALTTERRAFRFTSLDLGAADSRRHTARFDHLPRPTRSINSRHSPGLGVPLDVRFTRPR